MERREIMSDWRGELDVDNPDFRRASFDAWLSWEFMQRSVAGCREELIPSQIGELCGKRTIASRSIVHRALQHARCNA